MEQTKNLFVYHDPDYGYDVEHIGSWIKNEISQSIRDALISVGFKIIDAQDLKKLMASVVEGDKGKKVVVFTQDIAPDTVLDYSDASALIRQYLDSGGSVVWVGDIPFYYQAKKMGGERDAHFYESKAMANILGINTVTAMLIEKTEITEKSNEVGLETRWTGVRPILIDNTIRKLAVSKCSFGTSYFPIPPVPWWKRLTTVSFGIAQLNVGLSVHEGILNYGGEFPSQNVVFNKKVANAWFKNFNEDNPSSGFLRIWDYRPYCLSFRQIYELYKATLMCIEQKELEEEVFFQKLALSGAY